MVQGTEPKRVIIRAIGPELTQYGVPDALANPTLELHDGTGALIASNNNWATHDHRRDYHQLIKSTRSKTAATLRATPSSRQSSRICQRATTRRSYVV